MALKYYNGDRFVDCNTVKRWDGGQWVDCNTVKRWNGYQWVDCWNRIISMPYSISNLVKNGSFEESEISKGAYLTNYKTGFAFSNAGFESAAGIGNYPDGYYSSKFAALQGGGEHAQVAIAQNLSFKQGHMYYMNFWYRPQNTGSFNNSQFILNIETEENCFPYSMAFMNGKMEMWYPYCFAFHCTKDYTINERNMWENGFFAGQYENFNIDGLIIIDITISYYSALYDEIPKEIQEEFIYGKLAGESDGKQWWDNKNDETQTIVVEYDGRIVNTLME